MGVKRGRWKAAYLKEQQDDIKSSLARPAPVAPPCTPATLTKKSVSHGAAHNAYSKVRQQFGRSLAVAACTTVVVNIVVLFSVVAYMMANCGVGCLTWRDLLKLPCAVAILCGSVALALANLPPSWLYGSLDTKIGTPSVPTPNTAITKATAALVGAPGRRAPAALTHAEGPKAASLATLHKGPMHVKDTSQPIPRTKEESMAYLGQVNQAISKMGKEADQFAEAARHDVRSMRAKAASPAAEIIAMHAVSGDLLDYFEDVPARLTAQADALQNFVKVHQGLRQDIKEGQQALERYKAERRAEKEVLRKEMDELRKDMDFYNEPTQRILLGETAYVLASLVEKYVFEGKSSGFQHDLTLKQLKLLCDAKKLDAGQARRWEQVVASVRCFVSMEELVFVEGHLRTDGREAAHGYDYEKETATLGELQRWAGLHFSQYPQVHVPLMKMLDLLAAFSSTDKPCLPDRTFESSLHPTVRQKL